MFIFYKGVKNIYNYSYLVHQFKHLTLSNLSGKNVSRDQSLKKINEKSGSVFITNNDFM